MGRNSNTIDWKSGVEFEGATCFQGFHGTVQRAGVRILASSIRLHFLDLSFDIIKW